MKAMHTEQDQSKKVLEIETSDETQMTVQVVTIVTEKATGTTKEKGVCINLFTDTGSDRDGSQATSLTREQLRRLITTLLTMFQQIPVSIDSKRL